MKFAKPDASMRNVHTEIVTKMASTDQYEFLQDVKLNDVKKVWKKAISNGPTASAATETETSKKPGKSEKIDVESIGGSSDPDKVLKFYTVGNGSVKTLAKNYTLEAAAIAANSVEAQDAAAMAEDALKYVHCFLDVPADRSGGKPYQALINFNQNKKKEKNSAKKGQGREIVKIQLAADLPGMTKTPMLLYNEGRTSRTFIHPEDSEDSGYDKIRDLIVKNGTDGALKFGGRKAYFYSRTTKRGSEQDIVSVDIAELAPAQKW